MNLLLNFKNFMFKCVRVWKITRKPTQDEFKIIAKASALGILLIGMVGFFIATLMQIFKF